MAKLYASHGQVYQAQSVEQVGPGREPGLWPPVLGTSKGL